MSIAPAKARTVAMIFRTLSCSPSITTARTIATNGFRKLMAVASARGILATAANMQVTPSQPQTERRKCSRQDAPAMEGRAVGTSSTNSSSVQNAKLNRPALTWNGLRTRPAPSGRPSVFASREVTATSAPAPNISAIPVHAGGEGAMASLVMRCADQAGRRR